MVLGMLTWDWPCAGMGWLCCWTGVLVLLWSIPMCHGILTCTGNICIYTAPLSCWGQLFLVVLLLLTEHVLCVALYPRPAA